MQLQIQVLSTSIETKPTAKGSYQQLEVAYKDLSNSGKVNSKKIMSFASKAVFEALSVSKPTDVFDIEAQKNEKTGYWDWTKASKGSAVATVSSSTSAGTTSGIVARSAGGGSTKGGWETPEERARKQVYIIRQSSLSTAVAALTATGKTVPSGKEIIELAKQLEGYVFSTDSLEDAIQKDMGSIEDIPEDIPF